MDSKQSPKTIITQKPTIPCAMRGKRTSRNRGGMLWLLRLRRGPQRRRPRCGLGCRGGLRRARLPCGRGRLRGCGGRVPRCWRGAPSSCEPTAQAGEDPVASRWAWCGLWGLQGATWGSGMGGWWRCAVDAAADAPASAVDAVADAAAADELTPVLFATSRHWQHN